MGSKLADFLAGTKILTEVKSPINRKIQVVKSLGFGIYIQAEGLTQSGGIMNNVWRKPLKQISNIQFPISNVLILGLGGGTAAKIVRKNWQNAKISGVDIDPIMVELGKKYLKLEESKVKVTIDDAYDYVNKNSKLKIKKFDLILIDLYVGDEFPEKFETEKFISLVKENLSKDGYAIFNRLYWGEKRPQSMRFLKKLEKIFRKVNVVYPEANILFVCSLN